MYQQLKLDYPIEQNFTNITTKMNYGRNTIRENIKIYMPTHNIKYNIYYHLYEDDNWRNETERYYPIIYASKFNCNADYLAKDFLKDDSEIKKYIRDILDPIA